MSSRKDGTISLRFTGGYHESVTRRKGPKGLASRRDLEASRRHRIKKQVLQAARDGGFRIFFGRHLSLPKSAAGVFQLRQAMMWQRILIKNRSQGCLVKRPLTDICVLGIV